MHMVKTSAEGNIHRKTFAADMQFLHWRLHIKCTVVCVPQEQHIRLSQSMICSIEAEVKEKKEISPSGLGLHVYMEAYFHCIYFCLHATITVMHSK